MAASKRKGLSSQHAKRGASHTNSGDGKKGRPSYLDDDKTLEKVLMKRALGNEATEICGAMGWDKSTITHWLNMADVARAAGETPDTDKYVKFAMRWEEAFSDSMSNALATLRDSKDPRWVDRWIDRVARDGSYASQDRKAGRSQIGVQVITPQQASVTRAIENAKRRAIDGVQLPMLEEGEVVDGEMVVEGEVLVE